MTVVIDRPPGASVTQTEPTWQQTACILCECNCGLEVRARGRPHLARLRGDKRHPSSQGYTCEKALRLDHYQNGRDRLTSARCGGAPTARSRRSTGTPRSARSPRGSPRFATTHGGDAIFYYGGGGQGNHLAGAYATATRAALGVALPLERARAGEDRRVLGRRPADGRPHARRLRALRRRVVPRQEPVAVARIPARPRRPCKEIAKDPARTLIVIDPRRTETAELADIHLAGAARAPTRGCSRRSVADPRRRRTCSTDAFLADARRRRTSRSLAALASDRRSPTYAARCGLDEDLVRATARRIGTRQSVVELRGPRRPDAPHTTLVVPHRSCCSSLTGNFGKPADAPHSCVRAPLVGIANGESKRISPVAGARIVGGLVPCNVDRRRDPDRPPGALPRDARRERRTRRTRSPTRSACARRCARSTRSS